MNNRDLYKGTFDKVKSSGYKTMEEIMKENKKDFKVNRRLLNVMCCVMILVIATVTVNAATGGLIGDFFDKLLGGDKALASIYLEIDGEPYNFEVSMKNSNIGIYDAENRLVRDITDDKANILDFEKDNQSCVIDDKEYSVLLVCGVNEETGECHNQVRLYDESDLAKAKELFNPETAFDDDSLTVFCPYIDLE